jgi:hypothetical protein
MSGTSSLKILIYLRTISYLITCLAKSPVRETARSITIRHALDTNAIQICQHLFPETAGYW